MSKGVIQCFILFTLNMEKQVNSYQNSDKAVFIATWTTESDKLSCE